MKTAAKQTGAILLISAVLAVVSNQLNPRRIPWIQNWSNQMESKAQELGIGMLSLSIARDLFESDEAVFVDARPSSAFIKGHIPGAVSIPFEQLDDSYPRIIQLIGSGTALVVYCSNRMCDDALLLAREIKAMGGDSALFVDGYESWLEHGGEVER